MELHENWRPFSHMTIGITGAIDCLNAPSLLLTLRAICERLTAILTPTAARFICARSLSVLGDIEILSDDDAQWHNHIPIAKSTDILLIAPASANTIAKLSQGLADNLLTTFALSVRAPIVVAPSMADVMWQNRMVSRNVEALRQNGFLIIDPTLGTEVASLKPCFGAMPKPDRIRNYLLEVRRQSNYEEFKLNNAS
jgi:phosphopantothenoylcysteine synthetase/decarboxylase